MGFLLLDLFTKEKPRHGVGHGGARSFLRWTFYSAQAHYAARSFTTVPATRSAHLDQARRRQFIQCPVERRLRKPRPFRKAPLAACQVPAVALLSSFRDASGDADCRWQGWQKCGLPRMPGDPPANSCRLCSKSKAPRAAKSNSLGHLMVRNHWRS